MDIPFHGVPPGWDIMERNKATFMAETIHSFQVLTGSLFLFCLFWFVVVVFVLFCLFCFVCESCGLERKKAMVMPETIHSFHVLTGSVLFVLVCFGLLLFCFVLRNVWFGEKEGHVHG